MKICRPISILKKLKVDFSNISLSELELETFLHDNSEWTAEHECVAAILTCIRNTEQVLTDPILFSQIALGLIGIAPDFMEFEFIDPEVANVAIEFIDKMQLYHPTKTIEPSNDLKAYIGCTCAENGLFFLKNSLERFQEETLIVFKESFNNDIPLSDIEECEKLWTEYKDKKLEDIPEDSNNLLQIKNNILIREYTKEILS